MNNNQLLNPNPNQLPVNNLNESELSISALLSNLKRKWKPSLVVAITVFVWLTFSNLKEKPIYQSTMKMLVNTQEGSAVGYDYFSYRNINTEIEYLKSFPVLTKAVERLKNDIPNISVAELNGALSIATTPVPDVISITYTHVEPERTKRVLDEMAQIYEEYSIERQRSKTDKGLEFIEYQLPKTQRELDEINTAIKKFQERYEILNADAFAGTSYSTKEGIKSEIARLQLQLKLAKEDKADRERQLRETGYTKEINMADIVISDDGLYRRLESLGDENDIKINLEETKYNEVFPSITTAKLQQETIEKLRKDRKSEVLSGVDLPNGIDGVESMTSTQRDLAIKLIDQQRNVRNLESQLKGLNNALQKASDKVKQAPELQEVFQELKRQQAMKESTFQFLLSKVRDFKMSQAQEATPWQVLQPAPLPGSPISPNVRRSVTVALVAGFLTAIATALILDLLDQRVKRVEEIKELTRVPLLGLIPTVGQPFVQLHDQEEVTPLKGNSYYYKDSSFTEAIRGLAINLRYLMTGNNAGKVLAISSSRPSEGKSTITYNLGLVLAELGFNVLIVDGDMRKPTIHKLTNKSNETGLSSVISSNQSYVEMIEKGKLEKLDILTSGPTPPNPVALLDSVKFEQLINQWRDDYDYVLIDTPPLGIGADTVTIANKVDTVLLSIGMEKVTRKMITNSMETLLSNQVNVGGTIVNMIDSKHDYYNYYNYYYYYNNAAMAGNELNMGNRNQEKGMQKFLNYFRRR